MSMRYQGHLSLGVFDPKLLPVETIKHRTFRLNRPDTRR